MKILRFALVPFVVAISLTGCIDPKLTKGISHTVDQASESAQRLTDSVVQQTDNAKTLRHRTAFVDHPYLAGKSVALSPTANLPMALRANVKTALMFPGKRVKLAVAAEQITLATGIHVVISPDVYLPQAALLPRAQKLDDDKSASAGSIPSAAPVGGGRIAAGPLPSLDSVTGGGLVSAGYSSMPSIDTPDDVDIQRDEMPLPQSLDLIASRIGVNWEYDQQQGIIRIFRMVTKTWILPVKPASMAYNTQFDTGTAQSNNPNALQTTNDKNGNKEEATNVNEMTSILNDVQTVMTRSGSVSGNVADGTVTITDTKDAVDRAESIIDIHRAILSKLVTLHIRVVEITRSNNGQLGVDWQALLTKAFNNVPGIVLSSTSPLTLTTAAAGTIGLNITSGQFSGTQAVVNALSQLGTTYSSDDIPMQIQNRHSAYYDNVNEFSYVSQTTPAASTVGGTGGTPGITTSMDAVGLKFLVYSAVTDDNNIDLTVSMGNSALNGPIQTFTSGTGANQQSVQEVNKNKYDASTDGIVRNGGIIILTAHNHIQQQDQTSTLGNNIPMIAGGSRNAQDTRTTTLFVISASVRDMRAGQQDNRGI
jgi:type IVB pilus formation R64 PilN family outer membrane protein